MYSRHFSPLYILLVTVLLLSVLSCKSSKAIIPNLENVEEELFKKIASISLDYHWFSAKAKVRMESADLKGGGRMHIRMVKDSIIWFNFKKVSIEGARGMISPHEYTILYRTEKKYEKGQLDDLFNTNTLPITFSEMQSYLAGNVPLPIKSSIKYKKVNDAHRLHGKNDQYILSFSFDKELNLTEYVMSDDQNRKLAVEIGKRDEELGIYRNRKLTYYQNQKKSGILEVDLSNIEIDVPKKLPFSIPDHYTQY